jgi:signal transduction histidine kinase
VEGIIHDITGLRQARDALWVANKKLTLLSGITRHDINNQLLTLNGFVGILQKKISDPSFHNDFSRIGQVSRQIAAMIKFTREYEQIGANAPVWQDCRTIVDNAEKQALLNGIMVKNDLSAGSEVFADPLIIKVFYNLIDNAVRHGGKVTTVRFSLENSKDDLVIVCEDDGEGMPADQKEQIFDRGFGKNTGLGLFLAREILSITGIGIRETGKPGKGARFEMTVPKGAWRFWKGVK